MVGGQVNEEYLRAMFFFLHCAWCDGLLEKDETGKIIPNNGDHIVVEDIDWLKTNSPIYFKYYPKKRKNMLEFHTPEEAIKYLWREVGL